MNDTKRYRLVREGKTDRVEDLTDDQVKVRNGELARKGRSFSWIADPKAEDGELTDSPTIRAREAADTKAAGKKQEAKREAAKVVVAKAAGNRIEWNGFSMVEVIRHCGSRGYTPTQTRAVATHCGMDPAKGTVHIQLGVGRKGEGIPKLSKDQRIELDTVAKANKEVKAPKRTKLKEEAAEVATAAA